MSEYGEVMRSELAETQKQVALIADAFAQAIDVLAESVTSPREEPGSAAPTATEERFREQLGSIERSLEELSDGVQTLQMKVDAMAKRPAPAPDLSSLAVPLSAAFEKVERSQGDKLNALLESLREEIAASNERRTRALQREVDRVLYTALAGLGLLGAACLWLFLKP